MDIVEQTKEFKQKRNLFIKELKEQLPRFIGDSDMSPILVGVTSLENELEKYITEFLIESPSGKEDLFETGPLSTFSAKISIARRLGLINNELQSAVDTMRKIRNSANKSRNPNVFESEKILSLINSLADKYRDSEDYKEIENSIGVVEKFFLLKHKNSVKAGFIILIFYLIYTIQTGKLLAQNKEYKARLILGFP